MWFKSFTDPTLSSDPSLATARSEAATNRLSDSTLGTMRSKRSNLWQFYWTQNFIHILVLFLSKSETIYQKLFITIV